ncbi:hypothetical protein [Dapis sp. BLCC M229]|uniref:hypothetical protein n=1 Tax=Dapis sp. BLCC M229 TaxID=3400188 RepID=UPI003CFA1D80
MDLVNCELIIQNYHAGNGDCSVDFLKKLLTINTDLLHQEKSRKIIRFGDEASDHRGENMQ